MSLQGEWQPLSVIITDYLNGEECPFKESYLEADIKHLWEEIVGKTFSKDIKKISLRNGILRVFCTIAPVKNELSYQKDRILQRINERFAAPVVQKIIIV